MSVYPPFWKYSDLEDLLSKKFFDLTNNHLNLEEVFKSPNITWEFMLDILNKHPDINKHQCCHNLSYNKQVITFQIVKNNINLPWNFDILSWNLNITIDDVLENPDFPWDFTNLSEHPNISTEDMKNNPHLPWKYNYNKLDDKFIQYLIVNNLADYDDLSHSKFVTWDIVNDNLEKDWNWYELSKNPVITWENILNSLNFDWDWKGVSMNPNINWDIVKNNLDMAWDWFEISAHPNITWDIIEKNWNKPWNMCGVSFNPNITWKIVQDNFDKEWFWKALSQNPNITGNDIQDYLHLNWNWTKLSRFSGVDLDFKIQNNQCPWCFYPFNQKLDKYMWEKIVTNPNIVWEWSKISQDPFITWDTIEKNQDFNWDWSAVSLNPNINLNIVENNLNYPWDKKNLLSNSMNNYKNEWINQKRQEIISAFRIQRIWRNCISNPKYLLAKKKINKMFQEIDNELRAFI